jgi:uncharacterized membrane protein YidH (DUF202 family)
MSETGSDSVPETNPLVAFTDADLKAALRRAERFCAAMGIIGAGVFLFVRGWRSAVLCIAGTIVSLVGLYEWQQLVEFVNARLDKQRPPRSTGRVVTMFLLRLIFAAAVIYVSLKCSRGVPYGLITGLGLAVLALTIEALRLIRS